MRARLSPADIPVTGSANALAAQVERRVLDRLDDWVANELDDHVIALVERRVQEETERRAWRLGTEVL